MTSVEGGVPAGTAEGIVGLGRASRPRPRAARSKRVLGYRQFQVLQFVEATIARRGYAPSYDEIRAETGISTKGEVSEIVQALEKRGLLKRVGRGRVRRGRLWNKPRIKLALTTAFPIPDTPLD